jgi:hypothetical protein
MSRMRFQGEGGEAGAGLYAGVLYFRLFRASGNLL